VWNLVATELKEAELAVRLGAQLAAPGSIQSSEDPVIAAALWLFQEMKRALDETMRDIANKDNLSRQRAQEAAWRGGVDGASGSRTPL
jgi:hypothetical protein